MANALQQLADAGVCVWLDDLIASVTEQLEKAGAATMPAGAVKPASSGDQAQDAAPAPAAPRQTARG